MSKSRNIALTLTLTESFLAQTQGLGPLLTQSIWLLDWTEIVLSLDLSFSLMAKLRWTVLYKILIKLTPGQGSSLHHYKVFIIFALNYIDCIKAEHVWIINFCTDDVVVLYWWCSSRVIQNKLGWCIVVRLRLPRFYKWFLGPIRINWNSGFFFFFLTYLHIWSIHRFLEKNKENNFLISKKITKWINKTINK